MQKTAKKKYWLFLMAVILCWGLLPGETNASVASSDVWQTVLPTTEVTASSEYLTRDGQTILLNPLTESRTISISVKTNHSQMEGSLSYTVTPANAVTVSASEELTATQAGAEAALVLTPGQVDAETKATIAVRWEGQSGQVLVADFVTVVAPEETRQWPQVRQDATLTVGAEAMPGVAVPVTVTYPADTTQVVLSLNSGAAFPALTGIAAPAGSDPASARAQPPEWK